MKFQNQLKLQRIGKQIYQPYSSILKPLQILIVMVTLTFNIQAQEGFMSVKESIVIDSLKGFPLMEHLNYARNNGVKEDEVQLYIANLKREFIKRKYNLSYYNTNTSQQNSASKQIGGTTTINANGCSGEDFENFPVGQLPHMPNQVNNWNFYNMSSNATGNNCIKGTWFNGSVNKVHIRQTPYNLNLGSLFGGTLGPSPLGGGSKIAQLNDFSTPLGNRIRAEYVLNVTPTNTIFQYAYAFAIGDGGHACCDNPNFMVQVSDCFGNVLNCAQQINVINGSACSSTVTGVSCNTCVPNLGNIVWKNWQINYIDFTPYIGQCVSIDFIVSDCIFNAHPAVVFLDCLCGGAPIGNQIGLASPVTTSPLQVTICQGSPTTLQIFGATSQTWYGTASSAPIGTGPSIIVAPNSTRTYTVNYSTGNGCQGTKVFTVNVLPRPIVSINASTLTLCSGNCLTLTANSNVPNTSFNWTLPFNSTSNPLIDCPTTSKVYSVVGTAPNQCKNSAKVSVNVLPLPNLAINSNSPVVCQGDLVTLNATGASFYVWSPPNAFATGPSVTFNAQNSTVYSVLGTGANGCTNTAQYPLTVLNNLTVTANPPFICPGTTTTLSALGASTYTWILGNAVIPTTIIAQTFNINLTSSTPYTVCGSAPNSCSTCITGTIHQGSLYNFVAPDINICLNGGPCTTATAQVMGGGQLPGASYTWMPTGVIGSAVSICTTAAAVFTVIGSASLSPTGCPNQVTLNVTPINSCCPQPTAGMTSLSNIQGTYSGAFVMNSTQTLVGSASFQDAEIWMVEDVSLVVPPGRQLNLDKAHIYACGNNMWNGIVVQDGGQITTSANIPNPRNSLIEDAKIAIELDNISVTNVWPNYPIDIANIIFNKNYIGIKISNSASTLDSLSLGIRGCTFASRIMPYNTFPNTFLNWPSNIMSTFPGDLRNPLTSTTGLTAPYNLNAFPTALLKAPYSTVGAQIGVKIENIGNQNGIFTQNGIMFGLNYNMSTVNHNFNLFDGLAIGIDVKNASLFTQNNIFQNMVQYPCASCNPPIYGGIGINHEITNTMNAKLTLTGQYSTLASGNHFWDCITGVKMRNVYESAIYNCVFRSTKNASMAQTLLPVKGDHGIDYESNRFNIGVGYCQFNNLKFGVAISTPALPQAYQMHPSTGMQYGFYAGGIIVNSNYFGPLVTSTTNYSGGSAPSQLNLAAEYMGDAVVIKTPNTNNWVPGFAGVSNTPVLSFIIANKVNRTFRGFTIDGYQTSPLNVLGNSISIESDEIFATPHAFGYGIAISNNMGRLTVKNNTLEATANWNAPPFNHSISAIYCHNNSGTQSPRVECNRETDAQHGFHFDDNNSGTVWEGNEMCGNYAGLMLTNNGIIGTQGSPSLASGNIWHFNNNECNRGSWPSIDANWQTYCENSDPTFSFLYVRNFFMTEEPVNNNATVPNLPYMLGPSMDNQPGISRLYDCVGSGVANAVPNWRQASNTSLEIKMEDQKFTFVCSPNPTSSEIMIRSIYQHTCKIEIRDLTGRMVFSGSITPNETLINLEYLTSGIYLIEVSNDSKIIGRTKLFKTQ